MKKRRIPIVAAAVVLLLLAGAVILVWRPWTARAARVSLNLLHPFITEAETKVLDEVLGEFSSLYPRITVRAQAFEPARLRGGDLLKGPAADVLTATGPAPAGAQIWAAPPVPWSGSLWVLAARRDLLERAEDLAAPVKALREGSLTPSGFEELLRGFKDRGLTPLTLGNSHRWPFLLWLQHWSAATVGPEAVDSLPSGVMERDRAWMEKLRPAHETLSAWKARGWFDEAAWKEGWAAGLEPLADGRAVFALLSAPLLSALPAPARQELEFLPFPGSRGAPAGGWSIGSVYALGVSGSSVHPQEAALLVRYLTSPGVTRVLSRRLGRPFFAWDPATGLLPRVVPDWYGAVNTSQMRALEEAFGAP